MAEPIRSTRSSTAATTLIAEDLHVTYRIYEQRSTRVKDVFARRFKPRSFKAIQAVRGVSFEVAEGEVVGLIGSNGSGKTTLLSAIAGMLPPTEGAVFASSRPMLLGVGAALRRDVSGRRNIEIGGLALGLSRSQVAAYEQDIIDFSGLNEFIDLPLRAYSSGMRARLQFAIASAVDPEILLIDEALAVGDKNFKRKSSRRIDEIRENAGTVFLVSHNLNEIQRSCTRALWMDNGVIVMDGDVEDVIAAYTADDPPE